MTLATIGINGVPVESYGLVAIDWQEWASAPTVKYGTTQLIGRMGPTPTVAGIAYTPKPLILAVQTADVDLATDRTQLGAWTLALQGQLEIESADMPGRVCYGLFEQGRTTQFGGVPLTLLSAQLQMVGAITCYSPFWYDRSPSTFGGAAAARILLPVGTAPTTLRVWLCGPYTNPTLTLRDRTGTAIATMRFTDTAADNTIYLDLVCDLPRHIDRYVSGVCAARNNGYALMDPADTFFTVDPLDGCTLETDSGSLAGIGWRVWQV